jgi:hypothetical protein
VRAWGPCSGPARIRELILSELATVYFTKRRPRGGKPMSANHTTTTRTPHTSWVSAENINHRSMDGRAGAGRHSQDKSSVMRLPLSDRPAHRATTPSMPTFSQPRDTSYIQHSGRSTAVRAGKRTRPIILHNSGTKLSRMLTWESQYNFDSGTPTAFGPQEELQGRGRGATQLRVRMAWEGVALTRQGQRAQGAVAG